MNNMMLVPLAISKIMIILYTVFTQIKAGAFISFQKNCWGKKNKLRYGLNYIQATQSCHFKQLFQSIHKIRSLYIVGAFIRVNTDNYYCIENNKILRALLLLPTPRGITKNIRRENWWILKIMRFFNAISCQNSQFNLPKPPRYCFWWLSRWSVYIMLRDNVNKVVNWRMAE